MLYYLKMQGGFFMYINDLIDKKKNIIIINERK